MTEQKSNNYHIYEKLLIEPYLFIRTYFIFLLRRPKTAFTCVIKGKKQFSHPAIFLTVNTVLSFLITYLFRREIPEVPDEWSFITKFGNLGHISFFVMRLLVGFCIFLILIRCFTKNKDNFINFISKAFPVLCYSSFLYIPIVTLQEIYKYFFSKDFEVPVLSFLLQQPVSISLSTTYKYIFYFPVLVVFLLWWFILVYAGMKSQEILISKKAIFVSLSLFFIIKIGIGLTYSVFKNWDVINSGYIIATHQIDKELTKTPPNYTRAFILATRIAENKKLPPYIRLCTQIEKDVILYGN